MTNGQNKKPMIGVVLLGFGAPDSPKAVRPFLENILSDLKKTNLAVFEERVKEAEKRYQKIGGRSPLLEITQRQAQALENELNANKNRFKVYIGMRYWHPFIREAVEDIVRDKVGQVVVLSLAPHYSRVTAGASMKEFKKFLGETPSAIEAIYVGSWFDHPAYLDALAEKIKEGLAWFSKDSCSRIQVIFSAHSLPQQLIEAGDPYLDHLKATVSGVLERLGRINWQLAFQSKGRQGKWLGPEVGDVLRKLTREGQREVLVVPLSFVSDNVETLYDLDVALKDQAESLGIKTFRRAGLLNDSPRLIEAFAQIILEKVSLKQ